MVNVAVVYFSGYGHTARQAAAVMEGIQSVTDAHVTGIVVDSDGLIKDNAWHELQEADAIVFGCPTYMGCVPWQFKRFADASSKAWAAQGWRDKLAAGFTNSGSMNGDKHSTLSYLFTLSMQHAMLWVGTGLMSANKKASGRDDINYLGAFAGAMAQSPADASPDEAPGPGDLHTAHLFGQRIAQVASRWCAC
ncbi:NADPH-dependent FMN reductase [Pandoraea thiooxydans]|uniref:Flavoprotein WrbA n=1 Tax=Pandoraea thiooxydans TaxID=445709 RepID=A0A0G3EXH2_9BURK|nr:flavodoxin family protein [Pandoraea thiooxydans]AKJ69416.1 NADPH-dependent FMN reductase [Pandoraea thiooxydans]APR97063.1 NADPH-dependent FMN reductase [Pandoraea thiooxydans]